MAMSQERSACLGLWVLLLLGAGMEEVVEGCSCHPAHPQQLFCSAEIGELITRDLFKLLYLRLETLLHFINCGIWLTNGRNGPSFLTD